MSVFGQKKICDYQLSSGQVVTCGDSTRESRGGVKVPGALQSRGSKEDLRRGVLLRSSLERTDLAGGCQFPNL